MNSKNKYMKVGVLTVIAVLLLVFLYVRTDNKEKINETVLAEGTEILNNWLEEHPDIKYERLYGVHLHTFYDKHYDKCVSNALSGYFDGPEDRFQRFIFIPQSREMYLYAEDSFNESLISYLRKECFNCDEKDELSVNFTTDIELEKLEQKGLFKKKMFLSDAVSSEYSYVRYEYYDLYHDSPDKLLEDNDCIFSISISIDGDIDKYIEPAVDLVYSKENINRVSVEQGNGRDDSVYIYSDRDGKIDYRCDYTSSIDYSSTIQIKFKNDIYEEAESKEGVLDRINSFRNEVDNNPPDIKITMLNDGMDIVVDSDSSYELYFSSDKFLEGRKLYGKDWNEKEICYDFVEVKNGRYPYALCEKDRDYPVSIYNEETHFEIR